MAPALAAMPVSDARLVLHVSSAAQAIDADGTGSLSVHNDYASVAAATAALSEATQPFAVVLSGSRSEAVAVAAAAYDAGAQGNNVVHVFDGAFAAREVAPLARAEAQIAPTLTQALAARGLSHFDYAGADNATTVLVVPNGPHFLAAKSMLARAADTSVGVLGVRVLRPWDDAALLAALPSSVRRIHVLDEVRAGSSGLLFDDVQAALLSDFTAAPRAVLPLALAAGQSLTAAQWAALLRTAAHASDAINIATLEVDEALSAGLLGAQRLATFLDGDSSPTSGLGALVSRALRASDSARGLTRFDNYTQGGVLRADIVLGAAAAQAEELPVALAAQTGSSTLVVAEAALLKGVAAFDNLAQGASVVLNASGWEVAEVEAKLSAADRRALAAANARLLLIDAASVAEQLAGGEKKAALPREVASAVLLAAFVHAHTGGDASAGEAVVRKTLGTAPLGPGGVPQLVAASIKALQTVAFDAAAWRAAEDDAAASRAVSGTYNAFAPNADTAVFAAAEGTAASSRATWALPAWQFLFSEAYALDERAVRPDLHEQTWLVKCTENRRLTPTDYDRNVFHLELSTAGTGLKYEVGEALGVHGWNDADEVREFLEWYGMDGNEVVSVPSIVAPGRWESRSVFQLLQQRLDIFGKPPKRFYEALSGVATNRDEARWLRFIAAAEGSATFKKLSEVETVTYADVLRMFPSARLPLDQLMAEVQPIEPRHYSIASAQSAVGDSVHLLIVTVDWQTPSGSARFGQCTRYLAALKPGDEVTVSLKPSIMKLPPITSQPIIMAGLGTGAAPFRAYIQARAVQKAQGKPVGPLIYCFGSRHEASEFLYGEELKAYERDGLITLLTAFSRDQKNKM
jgi:sulfite reductase (NADPH) flavoprotein alpha-component